MATNVYTVRTNLWTRTVAFPGIVEDKDLTPSLTPSLTLTALNNT
jgi:hypothetical protein